MALAYANSDLELEAAATLSVGEMLAEVYERRKRTKLAMFKVMTEPELSDYCTAVLLRAAGGTFWPKCQLCIRPVREKGGTCRFCKVRIQKKEAAKRLPAPKRGGVMTITEAAPPPPPAPPVAGAAGRQQAVLARCEETGLVTSQQAFEQLNSSVRTGSSSYLYELCQAQGLRPVETFKGVKLYRMDEVRAAHVKRVARKRGAIARQSGSPSSPPAPPAASPVPAQEETAMATTDLVSVTVLTTALETRNAVHIALAINDHSVTFAGLPIQTRGQIALELAEVVQAASA